MVILNGKFDQNCSNDLTVIARKLKFGRLYLKKSKAKLHNACQLLMVNYRHLKVEYRVGIQASHQPTIFINTYLNISKLLK